MVSRKQRFLAASLMVLLLATWPAGSSSSASHQMGGAAASSCRLSNPAEIFREGADAVGFGGANLVNDQNPQRQLQLKVSLHMCPAELYVTTSPHAAVSRGAMPAGLLFLSPKPHTSEVISTFQKPAASFDLSPCASTAGRAAA